MLWSLIATPYTASNGVIISTLTGHVRHVKGATFPAFVKTYLSVHRQHIMRTICFKIYAHLSLSQLNSLKTNLH